MYLECLLENVGPLEFVDLSLPFDEDGNSKPLVLVGRNGSGKSILL
jgi:ABC-type sulfate/molybdate transport systems ATPase subunit